jgi:uncharacterized protein YbjT (DUF2867 family)
MRIVVIGGTGHVGSYLVPRLTRNGHEVVSLSRGVGPMSMIRRGLRSNR